MRKLKWLPWLVMLLIMVGFIALSGCAMIEGFVRGMSGSLGVELPPNGTPLTANNYLTAIGALIGAAVAGGWAGLKLSTKVGKVAKIAKILSQGLYAAKKSDTTGLIKDIVDAVGEAAEAEGVKKVIDKLYEGTKEAVDGGESIIRLPENSDPSALTSTPGPGTN